MNPKTFRAWMTWDGGKEPTFRNSDLQFRLDIEGYLDYLAGFVGDMQEASRPQKKGGDRSKEIEFTVRKNGGHWLVDVIYINVFSSVLHGTKQRQETNKETFAFQTFSDAYDWIELRGSFW